MKKLFVGNLPPEATEASVREMFAAFGTVRSIDLAHDIFTGKCKGFGFIGMEGHEARAADGSGWLCDGRRRLSQGAFRATTPRPPLGS